MGRCCSKVSTAVAPGGGSRPWSGSGRSRQCAGSELVAVVVTGYIAKLGLLLAGRHEIESPSIATLGRRSAR